MKMYKEVLKHYPELIDNLNEESGEFFFTDPSDEELKVIHEIMKSYCLAVEYHCSLDEEQYTLFDYEERIRRLKNNLIETIQYSISFYKN